MTHLSLTLFGGFSAQQDNIALSFVTAKTQALLAYLAIEADRPHAREALVTLFWGDYDPGSARANLRNSLSRLRKSLGKEASDRVLTSNRLGIQFNRESLPSSDGAVALDVAQFQAHLTASKDHAHQALHTCTPCLNQLEQAVDLYRGELLVGFALDDAPGFEDWLSITRAQVQRQLLSTVEILVDAYARRGDQMRIQHHSERWLALEPWSEEAHQHLMRAYAQSGRQAAALSQYRECQRTLSEELGTAPAAETVALFEAIRRKEWDTIRGEQRSAISSQQLVVSKQPSVNSQRLTVASTQPTVESEPSTPLRLETSVHIPPIPNPQSLIPNTQYPLHTLPSPATPFVGRTEELAHFNEQLQRTHRAVICGMPGMGKTSLALTLARSIAPRDQIFWHTFHANEGIEAAIWRFAGFLTGSGQNELWQMLQSAQQVGIQLPPVETIFDYLFHTLHGQGYLLCFDDFHGIDHDPTTTEPIRRLRQIREAGDVSIIVTSRRLPTFTQSGEIDVLEGLGLEETRSLLNQYNLWLSDEILEQLHDATRGNPQFLILAGNALQRVRRPVRLLARLAEVDDLERYLLEQVNRNLSEEEQAVMAALSVLEGYGGSRDVVEAILDGERVRDPLRSLTDHYLLNKDEGDFDWEYSQHAIVRDFFYQGLSRRERRKMHQRAAEYYAEEEEDDLKAALHYERAGDATKAVHLLTTDTQRLINQGQVQLLHQILSRFSVRQLEPIQWAAVNVAQGLVCRLLGQNDSAQESYAIALNQLSTILSSTDRQSLQASACLGMADVTEHENPQQALKWVEQGMEVVQSSVDSGQLVVSSKKLSVSSQPSLMTCEPQLDRLATELHIKLGSIHIALGDYDSAHQAIHVGLEHLQGTDHPLQIAALENLGVAYFCQGKMDLAGEQWTRGLEMSQRFQAPFKISNLLNNLGAYKMVAGKWSEAVEHFQEGLERAKRLGLVSRQALCTLNLGILYTWQGADSEAEQHLQESLTLANQARLEEYAINARYSLADLRLRQGNVDEAASLLGESEAKVEETQSTYQLPEIYRLWAQVKLEQDAPLAALDYAERSIALAQEMGMVREEGIGQGVLGQVLLIQEQAKEAEIAFVKSVELLADVDIYEAARTKLIWGNHRLSIHTTSDGQILGEHLLQEALMTLRELGARRELMDTEQSPS